MPVSSLTFKSEVKQNLSVHRISGPAVLKSHKKWNKINKTIIESLLTKQKENVERAFAAWKYDFAEELGRVKNLREVEFLTEQKPLPLSLKISQQGALEPETNSPDEMTFKHISLYPVKKRNRISCRRETEPRLDGKSVFCRQSFDSSKNLVDCSQPYIKGPFDKEFCGIEQRMKKLVQDRNENLDHLIVRNDATPPVKDDIEHYPVIAKYRKMVHLSKKEEISVIVERPKFMQLESSKTIQIRNDNDYLLPRLHVIDRLVTRDQRERFERLKTKNSTIVQFPSKVEFFQKFQDSFQAKIEAVQTRLNSC